MTYTLDPDQLADFRADLDIAADEVFIDDELQRMYNRSEGSYAGAVYYAWRQLLASASKMNDYKAAQSSESLTQLFTHVKEMMNLAYDDWNGETGGVGYSIEGGLISLNTDASRDNMSEWDGTQDVTLE
jgi:hypothetical protein